MKGFAKRPLWERGDFLLAYGSEAAQIKQSDESDCFSPKQ